MDEAERSQRLSQINTRWSEVFQARGGPSFAHCWSNPRSLDMAFRSGPCHCGQSKLAAKSACCAEIVIATI